MSSALTQRTIELLLRPLANPIQAAKHYTIGKARHDLIAGLTVAVVAVPQGMAYAIIAGVPPVYGLYTAIVQGIIGSLLSSSSQLSIGPINTLSLLVLSSVRRMADPGGNPEVYLGLVLSLTFLVGLIQLAFSAVRIAYLVQYVSHAVLVGFTAGAGILIAANQLPSFLGIAANGKSELPGLPGLLARMWPCIQQVNHNAVAIGIGAMAIVIIAKRISKFVPGPLIAAIAAGLLVWKMGWTTDQIRQIGSLPKGLPKFKLPPITWERAEKLFGGAMALAMVGMLEAYSIAKSIATHTRERIVPNREFVAQGVSNLVSSFFQCIPGSGSFSRSALNHQAGAMTCFSGTYSACFIAIIFLLFRAPAAYIPQASLAAILFVIAYGLVDWRYILHVLRSNRADACVCIVTLVATLVIPLEFAIFVGILLNIGLYLRTVSQLHLAEMVPMPGGPFIERPLRDRAGHKRVMLLQVDGDLYFPVADRFQDRLSTLVQGGMRVLVIRLKRTHAIDSTMLHVLECFARDMHSRGDHMILCGVRPKLMSTIVAYGLVKVLGSDNVFEAGIGTFTSAKMALARAKKLVGTSIDVEGLDVDDEAGPVTWEI